MRDIVGRERWSRNRSQKKGKRGKVTIGQCVYMHILTCSIKTDLVLTDVSTLYRDGHWITDRDLELEPGYFATNIRQGNAVCEKYGAIAKGNNIGVCSHSGLLNFAGPFSISFSCVKKRFHAAMSLLVQHALPIGLNIMPACVAVCPVRISCYVHHVVD